MTPARYCEDKAAPAGSSLRYALLLAPLPRREGFFAVHAFRQELTEAVEKASDPGVARARLDWWRSELGSMRERLSQHPVMRALADAVSRYEIPTERLTEMIDGAQLDLDYNRYPDFATLEVYCARTSGATTMLSAAILGSTSQESSAFARELGIALELARIVRDVGRDSRRNRIYIPLDELRRFDLDSDDIIALREDEGFERLMAMQIERARARIDAAVAALPAADAHAQKPHLALARMWRALLDEIAQLRGHTLNQQVALTPLRKLWIAWRVRVS